MVGTEVGGCLGRSSLCEPVEECGRLGTPLPSEQEEGMWQGDWGR